jgi:hypothetical protein
MAAGYATRSGQSAVRAVPASVVLTTILSTTLALGEGLPKLEWELADGSKVRIYGQIDMGVLHYDDGFDAETYAPVDNNNQSSRAGVTVNKKFDDWNFEARVEAEYKPYSSQTISILNQDPDWEFGRANWRIFEMSFENERYGTFSIGQGSMASDNTAEVDLSGTRVILYSQVSDTAGGQLFRDAADPALFGPAVRSAFNNYDGLSRKFRIRYDTPKAAGFGAQFSYGRDVLAHNKTDLADVALTYEQDFEMFEVKAAAAYAWQENDITIIDGSASVLHSPTGLNVTVAAGSQESPSRTGEYIYGKLGLLRKFVEWGDTAVAVDYYKGTDIASAGSDSESVGVALVQNVKDWNTEFWLTYRKYEFDDPVADYENGQAVFGGMRVKF